MNTDLIEYVFLTDNKKKKRPTRYVTATKETLSWIENFNNHRELLEPFWLPTVELPRAWESVWEGGYDTKDTSLPLLPFIKTTNMEYLRSIKGKLEEPMEAVNLIQQTPWTVNEKVFDVMKWAWENSIEVGDMPSREDESLPPLPSDFKTNPVANKRWRSMAARIYQHRASTVSRRLLVAKLFYVAKKLVGNRFFYPSQVDFRGRVYNVPAFLGIQGADMSRGLLHFHRPAKIKSEEAARWLAIQGANTYGNDKVTLDERVRWAHDFANTADDIASDPKRFTYWLRADKPWQFLAWCFEWAEYCSTGKVNSQLPVNMDASNNGVQILSMLMRDREGGLATNVLPTDKPADIYGVVSDKVIAYLNIDRENGNPIAGDWLSFGVDRKLAKRPTMVFPYGGTFYSCRDYVDDWYQDTLRKTKCDNPFSL
jgi:DNA-directed RNA polymerase